MREWQTVTVALAASSRRATGTPTSFERPTTTASAPSSSTPSWRSSSITPAGVQGTRPGRAVGEQAGVDRGEAVDVLAGIDRGDHRVGIDLVGDRQLDEDAVDVLVEAEPADQLEQLVLVGLRRQPVVDRAHPDLLAGPVLVADVDLGGRVLADDHRGQRRRPPGLGLVGARPRRAPARAPRRRPPCRR